MHDIEALRAERLALLRDISKVESVRATRPEARALLLDWVNQAAAYGAETLRAAVRRMERDGRASPEAMGFSLHATQLERDGLDLAPLLVALIGPKRVTEALVSHLDAVDEGPNASVRREHVEAMRARLSRLETIEEHALTEAERAGVPLLRRADADPAVVLMPATALSAAYAAAVAAEGLT